MRHLLSCLLLALLTLMGCAPAPVTVEPRGTEDQGVAPPLDAATRSVFQGVVQRVAPVAVNMCRSERRNRRCDFAIMVDTRPGLPANAFQLEDRDGRPVVIFTEALVRNARNADELAFILAHETAHHIAGHIPRSRQSANAGAAAGSVLAAQLGLDAAAADELIQLGGAVGARRFAKDFELEADALGTVIAKQAGFDPVRGAAYFNRIPDPGDRFLGTHPPNKQRIETVRRVAAGL